MTNLDPKHLDALVADLHKRADAFGMLLSDPPKVHPTAIALREAAATITALRAQIDRERAATIEAAAQWHMDRIAEANRQIAENNEYLAREGLTHSEANERCRETVWNSRVAIKCIRALHADATRAAMDAIRREAREQALREAKALFMEGSAPHRAITWLAASITPDPDTNADSRQQTAPKESGGAK